MPYADPERERRYQQAYWARNGGRYRDRTPKPPPVSRQQCLDEDVAQARVVAALEASRVGAQRAMARLDEFIASERRWIRLTSSSFRIEEPRGSD
jgi:hypothetical protein